MITIDKSINESVIYATLSELTTEISPTYQLELFNFFTNVTYTYDVIGSTYSNNRYDRISIELDSELDGKTIDVSDFKYIFYEILPDDSKVIVEKGLLKVIDSSESDGYIDIEPDEIDDDYISYQG